MNDGCFEDHLRCGSTQKKVGNNSADLSSWDFIPCTICISGSERDKEALLKGSREASASFSGPTGVFVIYTGIVNDLF